MTPLPDVLRYAARGWQVFPVKPRAKEPATGRGFYDATTNPATLRRWFRNYPHNVGIRTGTISGIAVLDIDGDSGAANLRDLEAKHGPLPVTLMSITGKGNHRWFAITGPVPSSNGRIAPHIDIKADGGYIVAPPSVHPSGKVYAWADAAIPLAPAPEWLLSLSRKPKPPPISERACALIRRPPTGEPGPYGRAALHREIDVLATTAPGSRNHALNRAAFCLFQLVAGGELDRDQVLNLLIDACYRNGLIQDDGLPSVRLTMRSAYRAGITSPRSRGGAA
jgi:hypothetical protein